MSGARLFSLEELRWAREQREREERARELADPARRLTDSERAYTLAQAWTILQRLHAGSRVEMLAEAGDGVCVQCQTTAHLFRYRTLNLCRRCALSRLTVSARMDRQEARP